MFNCIECVCVCLFFKYIRFWSAKRGQIPSVTQSVFTLVSSKKELLANNAPKKEFQNMLLLSFSTMLDRFKCSCQFKSVQTLGIISYLRCRSKNRSLEQGHTLSEMLNIHLTGIRLIKCIFVAADKGGLSTTSPLVLLMFLVCFNLHWKPSRKSFK